MEKKPAKITTKKFIIKDIMLQVTVEDREVVIEAYKRARNVKKGDTVIIPVEGEKVAARDAMTTIKDIEDARHDWEKARYELELQNGHRVTHQFRNGDEWVRVAMTIEEED